MTRTATRRRRRRCRATSSSSAAGRSRTTRSCPTSASAASTSRTSTSCRTRGARAPPFFSLFSRTPASPQELWLAISDYAPPVEAAGPAEAPLSQAALDWAGLAPAPAAELAPLDYDLGPAESSGSESSGTDDAAADDFAYASQRAQRRRLSALQKRNKVKRRSSIAARQHPQSDKFDVYRELALLHCSAAAPLLAAAGYDDRGAFAALTERVLRASPLFLSKRTCRKIVALAEIYKQQDFRDASAPTSALEQMDKDEADDTTALNAGGDASLGRRRRRGRAFDVAVGSRDVRPRGGSLGRTRGVPRRRERERE